MRRETKGGKFRNKIVKICIVKALNFCYDFWPINTETSNISMSERKKEQLLFRKVHSKIVNFLFEVIQELFEILNALIFWS